MMAIIRHRQEKPGGQEWIGLYQWIERFLADKPLSSALAVIQWQAWARKKLDDDWTPESIKAHIFEAWRQLSAAMVVDREPMSPALFKAVADVARMADAGYPPAACAVVYRSLAAENPERQWLRDWAEKWEAMADNWHPDLPPANSHSQIPINERILKAARVGL